MSDEEILKKIYDHLEGDDYAWWLPEWSVSDDEYMRPNKPTYEQFIKKIVEK